MTKCPNIPEVCCVSKIMLLNPIKSVPFPSQIFKIKHVWRLRFQQTGNHQQLGVAYFYNTCLSWRLYCLLSQYRHILFLSSVKHNASQDSDDVKSFFWVSCICGIVSLELFLHVAGVRYCILPPSIVCEDHTVKKSVEIVCGLDDFINFSHQLRKWCVNTTLPVNRPCFATCILNTFFLFCPESSMSAAAVSLTSLNVKSPAGFLALV